MALGNIIVNALNLSQGDFPTVENYFLYIGRTDPAITVDKLIYLNAESDLDVELGAVTSNLKNMVIRAKENGGANWGCVVLPISNGALWSAAVDLAMAAGVKVEAIVIANSFTAATLPQLQTKADGINATYGRRLFFIVQVTSNHPSKTWGDTVTDLTAIVQNVDLPRVIAVPSIVPLALGILAGRLSNQSVSIADSPLRVATGAVKGLTEDLFPDDINGIRYNNAHAKAMNDIRLSVPQTYADYPGVFWSDGTTLAAPGSDYTVIENLRVVDKAARAVRLVLISLLGNRRFNSSPIGEAWAVNQLMRPLFEMSRSYTFLGIPFPAELKAPQEGDIQIHWLTHTKVEVFMIARMFEIPKDITANIVLDLSAPVLSQV